MVLLLFDEGDESLGLQKCFGEGFNDIVADLNSSILMLPKQVVIHLFKLNAFDFLLHHGLTCQIN